MDRVVERVARAFYDAQSEGSIWEREIEELKQEFRLYARQAISIISLESWQTSLIITAGAETAH